jgi:hypothetical protein
MFVSMLKIWGFSQQKKQKCAFKNVWTFRIYSGPVLLKLSPWVAEHFAPKWQIFETWASQNATKFVLYAQFFFTYMSTYISIILRKM